MNGRPWGTWLFKESSAQIDQRASALRPSLHSDLLWWMFRAETAAAAAPEMNGFTLISWLNQITSKKWARCHVKSSSPEACRYFLIGVFTKNNVKSLNFVSLGGCEAWSWTIPMILWSVYFMKRRRHTCSRTVTTELWVILTSVFIQHLQKTVLLPAFSKSLRSRSRI